MDLYAQADRRLKVVEDLLERLGRQFDAIEEYAKAAEALHARAAHQLDTVEERTSLLIRVAQEATPLKTWSRATWQDSLPHPLTGDARAEARDNRWVMKRISNGEWHRFTDVRRAARSDRRDLVGSAIQRLLTMRLIEASDDGELLRLTKS